MRAFFRSLPGLSFAIMLFLPSFCGAAAQEKAATTTLYAGEPFVIDHSDWLYVEKGDGTGYREHTVAVTVQADASLRLFGVVAVGFASASEHVEFHYARVRHKDGTVTETPVTDALEQPEQVTRDAPFYSDLKEMQLPVKNLRVGDTLEWQARIVRTQAEAPGWFWGAENFVEGGAVTREESIELRLPQASATQGAATVWTNPGIGVTPTISTDGGTKIYRWAKAQLKPTTGADADAAKKAKKTTLLTADEVTDAEQGKLPAVAWTSFKDWEAVGAWYRKLEGDRAVPDDEIKAKVAELTAGKTTEEEKVRAVYAYVSAQIRYIGVAFGVGRLQPHEAADVLHNQYGDCKDKATLLSAMLAALGLPSDAVLIGAGVRFNAAVASPASFNHMITRVRVGGQGVWLDATEGVAPYKMIAFILRDRQALVIPGQGTPAIERTTKDLPFGAADLWEAKGTMTKDGVSDSHIAISFRGDDELVIRSVVHQVPPSSYDEMVQKIVQGFGYAGTVSHGEVSRPDDTVAPFTMAFDYHRELGSAFKDFQILGQVAPVQLPMVSETEPPVQAIELGVPRTELSRAEMKLPEGWGAQLPEAVHQKTEWVTYDMTYRLDKGTLYTERKIVVLQPKVPVTDWKLYKKWADAVGLGLENYIVLQPAGASSASGVPNQSDRIKALFLQASADFGARDQKALDTTLKSIEKLDATTPRLWAYKASLASMRGHWQEAIEDDRKEVHLHTEEMDRWPAIFYAQMQHGQKVEATETLRDWASAAPNDAQPRTALSGMLMADKKMDEAVQAASEAMKVSEAGTPTGDAARLQFGKAALAAGKIEDGRAALLALLHSGDDPLMLNNAAYELANAKLELPLAEESERKALATLDSETASWTMDERLDTLKAKTSLLQACWDTMGWILYREGKFAEAESWLKAAELGRPDADVMVHIVANRAALAPPGKATPDPDSDKSDQQMRTIPLGASSMPAGTSEYRLLLSHGHVERAVSAGGKWVAGGEETVKKADFARYFPKGSDAKLVRTGMLNCVGGKCELVLEP